MTFLDLRANRLFCTTLVVSLFLIQFPHVYAQQATFDGDVLTVPELVSRHQFFSAELSVVPGAVPFQLELSGGDEIENVFGGYVSDFDDPFLTIPSILWEGDYYWAKLALTSWNPVTLELLHAGIGNLSRPTISHIYRFADYGRPNYVSLPFGMVKDSAGNLIVAGSLSYNVVRIAPDGSYNELIDRNGDNVGNSLESPQHLAIDSRGNIFVAGSRNVFRISPEGTITHILGPDGDFKGNYISRPDDLVTDKTGNLFVLGSDSSNIFRVTPSGEISEYYDYSGNDDGNSYVGLFNAAFKSMTIDEADNLIVSNRRDNNILRISPYGSVEVVADYTNNQSKYAFQSLLNISIDSSGNIYGSRATGELCQFIKISTSGEVTVLLSEEGDGLGSQCLSPSGSVTDAQGNVYVIARGTDNAFRIAPNGQITEILNSNGDLRGNTLSGPTSIFIDDYGTVFIGTKSDSIYKFSTN